MQLPKVNGGIDLEMLSDLMITKILVRVDTHVEPKVKRELEKFVQEILVEVHKNK
jgi:hypothetical protein